MTETLIVFDTAPMLRHRHTCPECGLTWEDGSRRAWWRWSDRCWGCMEPGYQHPFSDLGSIDA